MNYFEFIKNNDKSKDEIKEYYQSQYPKYYDLWYYGFWKAHDKTGVGPLGRTGQPKSRCTSVGMTISLYLTAYIIDKKPKSIIEYGSGFTTFLISSLLEDLNYGGSLITFEDSEGFYKMTESIGFYEKMNGNNRVELVPVKSETISDKNCCYYDYDLNKIESVDFVFDDGPDLIRYGAQVSTSMLKLKEHFDKPFDYLIDGRTDTTEFYKNIYPTTAKSSWLGLDENTPHEREDGYECGLGTLDDVK
jgi:hypothetical protein